MVNEFYQGLPSNYANYEDVVLPKHESMREKTRRDGVYGYHDHWNKDAYTWIDRFLENSVGKKFDNVYSKVCERFRKKKDFGFREEFKSRIDPRNMSDVYWHSNDYYLDSNHIIRRYKPIKNNKRRKYVMELDRSEDYYIVNKEKLFLEHPEIVLYLKAKLGKDKPSIDGRGKCNIWHYSETGHLHGIGERVDLSRFMNGTTIKDLML